MMAAVQREKAQKDEYVDYRQRTREKLAAKSNQKSHERRQRL